MTSKMTFCKASYALVASIGFLALSAGFAGAAEAGNNLTVSSAPVRHFMLPYGAKDVISPDGRFLAHFGKEYPAALYVRNLKTGQETLIAKGPEGLIDWAFVSGISFSPDGSRLVFAAGSRHLVGNIYSVGTDGSSMSEDGPGMIILASDSSSHREGEPMSDMDIGEPSYSPDGSKILVRLDVSSGRRDKEGYRDHSEDKTLFGLLSAEGSGQTPERLAEGIPLFWTHNGAGIYYTKIGVIYRYDLASKQSKLVLDTTKIDNRIGIAGRVPGTDAIFATMASQKGQPLTVISLDGTPVSQHLKDFAAALPREDADGRTLNAIEEAGPHHLILRYKPTFDFLKHGFRLEEVKQLKESGKLDPSTQEVDFP